MLFFDDVENDVVSFHSFISKIKFLIRDTYFKRTKLMKINKEWRKYKKNVSKKPDLMIFYS